MYIIPSPKKININKEERLVLKYNTKIIIDAAWKNDVYKTANLLKVSINKTIGFEPEITKSFDFDDYGIYLLHDSKISSEGYKLYINKNGIKIYAQSRVGLLYGVQTLRQIISQDGAAVSFMEIEDEPAIANRGFFHDATRGRVELLESYKRLADTASYYKLNQLQLYIEHSFMFKDFSEVWRDDTPLTAEDILELDEYCADLCIDLVPSIATFGHLDKVLKTKSFSNLCELENSDKDEFRFVDRMQHHTIDISNEESHLFIKKMLKEFIPLFRSQYFNICADETFDLGKGKSIKLAEEKGVHRLYLDFVNELCEYVISYGKKPMFWGDILLGAPELVKELPEGCICLNWGYSENEQENNAKKMYETGVSQYMCPGVHGWRHLINRIDAAYANISRMSAYAFKYNAIGILNTDWGDYGHTSDPEFSVPGLIYGAAFSWNPLIIPEDEINRQISAVEYLDKSEKITGLVNQLANQEALHWEHAVQYREAEADGAQPDKLCELMKKFVDKNASEANEMIDNLSRQISETMIYLDSSKRKIIKKYLLHSNGQKLLNTLSSTILLYRHGIDAKGAENPEYLASKLEKWFSEYKESWHQTSKESELYHVQEVIFYYADLLRSIN